MLPRTFLPLFVVLALAAAPLLAQQNTAAPAGDDVYAQIPLWGESGEKKFQSGDITGASEDFKKAFEASRELKRQYPQEPAYADNAYYYLARLAATFAKNDDWAQAVKLCDPAARGYAELATATPTADNTEKAANAFVQLSWYQVLTSDGTGAETSARKALTYAPDAISANVNLAHALLLNGKRQEAENLYKSLQPLVSPDGRSVRDIIIDDFDAMEKAGVAAAGIPQLRKSLGSASAKSNSTASRNRKPNEWSWPFFVLIALVIAAVFAILIYFDRKRTAKVEAAVKALGYTFRRKATPEDKKLTAGSQLWTVGRNRSIRNIIEVPESDGTRLTLFEFTYVTGAGKASRTHYQTVARFQSTKLHLPTFDLRPEGLMSKLVQNLGFKDIDIEDWPKFSGMFQLRGPEDAAIAQVFTPPVLQYCEQHKWLWMSGAGNLLWIHRENYRAKPNEIETYVATARSVFALFAASDSASAHVAPPPLPPLPPPPLPTA